MRRHLSGWIVNFGSQRAIEANADYHSYDLSGYRDRCGLAAMTPSALGATVWLRTLDGHWWGPCLVVDTVSRVDWHHSVIEVGEVIELPHSILKELYDTDYGVRGEIFIGDCPPALDSVPAHYRPPVTVDYHRPVTDYSAWPYPPQGRIMKCDSQPIRYGELR